MYGCRRHREKYVNRRVYNLHCPLSMDFPLFQQVSVDQDMRRDLFCHKDTKRRIIETSSRGQLPAQLSADAD
jgi:hypothetical protein